MEAFRNPSTPPAAKALSLVRLHHGAPNLGNDRIPTFDGIEKKASHAAWSKGARLNHLNAKRRQRNLDDISETSLPVILEIDGGSNFVIMKERLGKSECVVQFPDSREASVNVERLNERYSGFCVFLSPVNENARSGLFSRLFSSLKS